MENKELHQEMPRAFLSSSSFCLFENDKKNEKIPKMRLRHLGYYDDCSHRLLPVFDMVINQKNSKGGGNAPEKKNSWTFHFLLQLFHCESKRKKKQQQNNEGINVVAFWR